MATEITQEFLLEVLDYVEETGKLYWKHRGEHLFNINNPTTYKHTAWNTKFAGKESGTCVDSGGYKCLTLGGKRYRNHRIIWFLKTGQWPETIDHIDGDKVNNRWSNLRDVSYAENNKNLGRKRNNTSGATGVQRRSDGKKWVAKIEGEHLGCFTNFEDAVRARKDAERRLGYHENHGRVV